MTRTTPKYVLLTALLVLAGGCSTSGVSAFHGVGAAPKRQANAPVQVARDVAPESPAALGRTQKVATDAGLSLNVAGAAQPQTLAATNVPPQPEMGTNRAEAVSGIRAKAENSPDTPPNVFDVKRPPVNQMTAAVALIMATQTGVADVKMGGQIMLVAFIATVLGGLGSLPGAVAAGFLVGIVSVVLQTWLPLEARPFRDAFLYTLVIVCLLLRPQGLFVPASAKPRV